MRSFLPTESHGKFSANHANSSHSRLNTLAHFNTHTPWNNVDNVRDGRVERSDPMFSWRTCFS